MDVEIIIPEAYLFFGRGRSIGYNLPWTVPEEWHALDRDIQIALIKKELAIEVDRPSIDCTDIRRFLRMLSRYGSFVVSPLPYYKLGLRFWGL